MSKINKALQRPAIVFLLGLLTLLVFHYFADPKIKIDDATRKILDNTLYINLESGRVVVELYPEVAPMHVERIKKLVRSGFYDGAPWHRVVSRTMAQCCDRSGTSVQTEGTPLAAELSDLPHIRGTVSMARGEDINSATSQFFITTTEARFLDGKYTVFGFVREGIELIEGLKKGDRTNNDIVADPDVVISMTMAIDDEKDKIYSSRRQWAHAGQSKRNKNAKTKRRAVPIGQASIGRSGASGGSGALSSPDVQSA